MAMWIKTVVKHKSLVNGKYKDVSDIYMVNALTCTEAEARALKEIELNGDDYNVATVGKTSISEVFDSQSADDTWYQVKAAFIEENDGKEKIVNYTYLVKAYDFRDALDSFEANMKDTVSDYEIISITETKILKVIHYKNQESE